MSDDDVVAAQIGRPIRGEPIALVRCHLALPVVVSVPPVLPSGEPFPTRYWLSCPLAHWRIARLEEHGGVREYDARLRSEPGLAAAFERANAAYAAARDAHVPADAARRPTGGVGGTTRSVKCLHAHFAHFMAEGENPIGKDVAARIGELRCDVRCVAGEPLGRNPAWRPG